MYCDKCGSENNVESNLCIKCGNHLSHKVLGNNKQVEFATYLEETQLKKEVPSIAPGAEKLCDEEKLRLFVGKKKEDYYIKKWIDAENPMVKSGFNWAAFWIAPFWLGYRKMYKWVLIYFAICLGIDCLNYFFIHSSSSFHIGTAFGVAIGIYGNSFYLKFARENITNAEKRYESALEQTSFLKKKGGTTKSGIAFVLLIFLVYAVLSDLFF